MPIFNALTAPHTEKKKARELACLAVLASWPNLAGWLADDTDTHTHTHTHTHTDTDTHRVWVRVRV